MKEFFGFGGYQREPEGYFSWQHLLFVTCFMIVMVTLAVILGRKYRHRSDKEKNLILIWSAILIDSFELFKIILVCIRSEDPMAWLLDLPLFLCSIQLITIPLAAFSKGRVREAALDFVFIFGILGAVLGTYLAGNNYSSYPVLSFDNTVSAITHSISGFTSLYIVISGMESMKKKNIKITFAILLSFCVAAYIANVLIPYNYMFLMAGDGTPYDIIYNLVGGNPVIYPLIVVALFLVYIVAFRAVYELIVSKLSAHKHGSGSEENNEAKDEALV
ncbi:MAG: YwaF family protein [Clostridia bacterium]|nr:YwaF family protein [Clostridia bacterium]